MKRFATILLALTMLASVGSTVYAEESGTGDTSFTNAGESTNAAVYGYFEPAEAPQSTYSVKVEWDSLEFSCTVNGTATWLPGSHTYNDHRTFTMLAAVGDVLAPTKDSRYQRTIRVTNNSNADVYVKTETALESDNYNFTLNAAPQTVHVNNLADNPHNNYADFTVTITPPTTPVTEMPQEFTVGIVTISVSANDFNSP